MGKRVAFLLLTLLAVLTAVAPVAANRPEPVGSQLSLSPGNEDFTFPAGEPFNISHGWGFTPPDDNPRSGYGFDLWVDGEYRETDFIYRTVATNPGEGPFIVWRWVHNFPNGLTGSHTFLGEWFASCETAVAIGWYPGPCTDLNERVVLQTNTVEVVFTP